VTPPAQTFFPKGSLGSQASALVLPPTLKNVEDHFLSGCTGLHTIIFKTSDINKRAYFRSKVDLKQDIEWIYE
jgi:hypothetical protein